MDRDLRESPLYKEIQEHFRRIHEPGFGRISEASDPSPSPDGRLIAFTGRRVENTDGDSASRICTVDTRGHDVQEITAGPNDDRLPRWSPDGTRLAFLSDRREKDRMQLYVLESDRLGEALATPQVDGAVEYHSWSPEGDAILFAVAGSGADLAGAQGSGTVEVPTRDFPSWMPSVERAPALEGWRSLWLYDADARTARRISREGLNVWEADWCGPRQIAAVVSDAPGEEAWYTAPLALIDVESGKERVLYRGRRQLGLPAASRSGRRLAIVEALCSDRMIVAGDLLLIDPDSGQERPIDTGGVDVTYVAWRDDDRLLFAGLRGLQTVVGEYDANQGSARELWTSGETSGDWYPHAQPLGHDAFALVLQSYDRYPEVVSVRDGDATVLTSLSHDGSRYLRGVAGHLEGVSWSGTDGLEIEGFLAAPEAPGPHPLIVLIHGGPVWTYSNHWSMGRYLTPLLVSRGYAVLHPNPRGSAGRGQGFAEMVYGDMGGADAEDILAGVDAMVERRIADPARLGVTGGSYGGFMSAWLVTRTNRFTAAVALSPVTDWYSQHYTSNIGFWDRDFLQDDPAKPGGAYFDRSPVMFAERVTTPTLLTAGALDKCTPPGQAVEFHRALAERGIETEVVIYPEEGHGVRKGKMPAVIDWHTRTLAWFERYMPASAR